MIVPLRHFLGWLVSAFRSREDLVLENLALRRQLLALHTQQPRRRLTALICVLCEVAPRVKNNCFWWERRLRLLRANPLTLPCILRSIKANSDGTPSPVILLLLPFVVAEA
jgi:hypothetical protein